MLSVRDWVGETRVVTVSSDHREMGPLFVLERRGVVIEFEIEAVVGGLLDEVEVRMRTVWGRRGSWTAVVGLVILVVNGRVVPETALVRTEIGVEALRGRVRVARLED